MTAKTVAAVARKLLVKDSAASVDDTFSVDRVLDHRLDSRSIASVVSCACSQAPDLNLELFVVASPLQKSSLVQSVQQELSNKQSCWRDLL